MEFFPSFDNWEDNVRDDRYDIPYAIIPCTLDYPYDWIEEDEENWFTLFLTLNKRNNQIVEKIEYADENNPYSDISDLRNSEQRQILYYLTELGFKFH